MPQRTTICHVCLHECASNGMPHCSIGRKRCSRCCVVHAKSVPARSMLTRAGLHTAQHFCTQLGLGWEPAGVYYFVMLTDLHCAGDAAGAAPADQVRGAHMGFSCHTPQHFCYFHRPLRFALTRLFNQIY